MSELVAGMLSVGDRQYKTEEGLVPIVSLLFYDKNPRIYSLIQASGLSQEQIEEKMRSFDHVKQLSQSIEKVGLIDPIIVRKSDMSVLEGNSRLAAYRILASKKPHQFAKIQAKVIVDPISDEDIDILLGQYHIVGRKDWDPYEQAAFIHRQIQRGVTPQELAESYGLSVQKVKRSIANYQFMVDHKETNPNTYSHWDEYLNSKYVKKVRSDDTCRDDLDTLVINLVRKGEIKTANQDMRKINDICSTAENRRRAKIFNEFLDGETSFADAYAQVEAGADASSVIKTCEKFRSFIASSDTRDHISEMTQQDKSKLDYELKKVVTALKTLGYID